MAESIVTFFESLGLAPQLVVFFVAMTPVLELRGAIPIGMGVFGLSAHEAFLWAVLGNLAVVAPLLVFLQFIVNGIMRHSAQGRRFFRWLFDHTRTKHSHRFKIYKRLALLLFVATPLPGTGAWSGALAAYVFDIKPRFAVPIIAAGVCVAGILVTLISTGAFSLFG